MTVRPYEIAPPGYSGNEEAEGGEVSIDTTILSTATALAQLNDPSFEMPVPVGI